MVAAAMRSMRQELIRRLNATPHGTRSLVRRREKLLVLPKAEPELTAVDSDFARWLKSAADEHGTLGLHRRRAYLAGADWRRNEETVREAQPLLLRAAARYFLGARTGDRRLVDPAARVHRGNGARLERLDLPGDVSARDLRESRGFMVNYLYKLDDIGHNHEAYAERDEVVASPEVCKWVAAAPFRKAPSKPQERMNA